MATNYKFASFRLDTAAEALFRGAATTPLGRRAVALLRVLIQQPGVLVSKDALIEAAWPDQAVEESNLPVQIAAVRRVLGEEPGGEQWIETLPRRGYRYVGPAVSIDGTEAASRRSSRQGLEQVAIAVLPFTNLSGHADQQYFGDAIGNDIITALTRFRWFSVVARNSSFAFRDSSLDVREIAERLGARYVVEGSHRQVGHRIRITAQLIDATTGNHIWAERYERDLADIFVIQDEITDSVIGAIEPQLLKTESRLAHATGDVEGQTAWNLVRRGVWQFHKVERESHQKARDLFCSAAALDPQLVEAHIWLARVSGGIVLWGWSDEPVTVCQEGLTAAFTAIRLDEKSPYAHYGLAITSCAASEFRQAARAATRAIDLSPGFALGHLVLGMARLYSGDAKQAKQSLHHGLRLNSSDPHNFAWLDLLALAHMFTGATTQAIEAATEAVHLRPDWHVTLNTLAICCAAAGRSEDARRYLEAAEKASAYPGDLVAPLKAHNPTWRCEIQRLLQSAREGAPPQR
jgi:TolB-like protein/Flp pilus assembly protein TadD